MGIAGSGLLDRQAEESADRQPDFETSKKIDGPRVEAKALAKGSAFESSLVAFCKTMKDLNLRRL